MLFRSQTTRPSLLREMNPEDITSLDVSIAAGKGDELANEIYQFTGKMLGEACADFAAFSSPEAFIFFGGMVKAGELIMKPIREAYNEHVMNVFKGKAKFLVSGLDGASAAVLVPRLSDGKSEPTPPLPHGRGVWINGGRTNKNQCLTFK